MMPAIADPSTTTKPPPVLTSWWRFDTTSAHCLARWSQAGMFLRACDGGPRRVGGQVAVLGLVCHARDLYVELLSGRVQHFHRVRRYQISLVVNRALTEAEDHAVILITGLEGLKKSEECNPKEECADPDNTVPHTNTLARPESGADIGDAVLQVINLEDAVEGSNNRNLFQSVSGKSGMATWNSTTNSLTLVLAKDALMRPFEMYQVTFRLNNEYQPVNLQGAINIAAILGPQGQCMRSGLFGACPGQVMIQPKPVEICAPAFIGKMVGQEYPWPGCDMQQNTVGVTLTPNVDLEGMSMITIKGFRNAENVTFNNESHNVSFTWDDDMETVTLMVYKEHPMDAGEKYEFIFELMNPMMAQPAQDPQMTVEATSAPKFNIAPSPLMHDYLSIPIDDKTLPGQAAGLLVMKP
eukprot:3232416-Rhodomonas_salina.1